MSEARSLPSSSCRRLAGVNSSTSRVPRSRSPLMPSAPMIIPMNTPNEMAFCRGEEHHLLRRDQVQLAVRRQQERHQPEQDAEQDQQVDRPAADPELHGLLAEHDQPRASPRCPARAAPRRSRPRLRELHEDVGEAASFDLEAQHRDARTIRRPGSRLNSASPSPAASGAVVATTRSWPSTMRRDLLTRRLAFEASRWLDRAPRGDAQTQPIPREPSCRARDDLRERSARDGATRGQDHHVVTRFLDVGQPMAAEDDAGSPSRGDTAQQREQILLALGSSPTTGSSRKSTTGSLTRARAMPRRCRMPWLYVRISCWRSCRARPRRATRGHAPWLRPFPPIELAEVADVLDAGDLVRQTEGFGKHADARADLCWMLRADAIDGESTCRGPHDGGQDPDRRGLPGSVRPEEPHHVPALEFEREVLERVPSVVGLRQPLGDEDRRTRRSAHSSNLPLGCPTGQRGSSCAEGVIRTVRTWARSP